MGWVLLHEATGVPALRRVVGGQRALSCYQKPNLRMLSSIFITIDQKSINSDDLGQFPSNVHTLVIIP